MHEKCREIRREIRRGQATRTVTEFLEKREEALRKEKGREEGGTRREDAHGGVVRIHGDGARPCAYSMCGGSTHAGSAGWTCEKETKPFNAVDVRNCIKG
jgi:hypothetical protein